MRAGSRQSAARSPSRVSCIGAWTPASASRAEIAPHSASLAAAVQGKSYIGRIAIGVSPFTLNSQATSYDLALRRREAASKGGSQSAEATFRRPLMDSSLKALCLWPRAPLDEAGGCDRQY